MGKSKINTVVIHHAPEVVAMATSSSERIVHLLAICDYHKAEISKKAQNNENVSQKDSQSLIRTILSLEKALDKYNQILHPPIKEILPLETSIPDAEAQASSARSSAPKTPIPLKKITELSINDDVASTTEWIPNALIELSVSGEQPLSEADFNESVTEEWEETQLAAIENSRQSILKDIETGKLTRRQGLEMIGDMEWRFKRELQERQAAEQNKKSRNRWAG
jgi:hypothetical protein